MSAVCPSCGVAVVPGYAKCPKCQASLPYGRGGSRRIATRAGGTAVEDRRFPIIAIAAPIGGIVLLVVLVKMCSGGGEEARPVATGPATPTSGPQVQQPQTNVPQQQNPTTQVQQPIVDASAAQAELDRVLRMKRFWSTIDIRGSQVDVRSAACDDPGMPPVIDGVVGTLRGAGLTRLRCLAQSGVVVFERNL
jgi:hypothetical protein